jgi:hypothetical protein
MIDAISSAVSGIRSSANQFDNAAQRVVQATMPETSETSETSGWDDLPAAIVDTKMSELSFKANAEVFKTADKMTGALLDLIA